MRSMPERTVPSPPSPRTASNRTAAEVNVTVLLDILRSSGAVSRSELVRRSGLSNATVNRLVDRLMGEGIVRETGGTSATGGRPARLVEFNAGKSSVLALDVGGRRIAGAVTDLEARTIVRAERSVRADARSTPRIAFDTLVDLATELMGEAEKLGVRVESVGVGVPGVVRNAAGRVEFAPAVGWFDLPLVALLEERLSTRVRVENDVNLLALAENRHGATVGYRDVVTIAVGTGVGAALIIDGRLYRGTVGAAGEIGYQMLDRSALESPWPGFGDLESRIGTAGIHRRWAGSDGVPELGSEQFLEQVRAGEPSAVAVFDDIVDDVALAVGNISVVLNPEIIALGGGFGKASADLMIQAVQRRLQGRIPFEPLLVPTQLDDAELIGAAELAIDASAISATLVD